MSAVFIQTRLATRDLVPGKASLKLDKAGKTARGSDRWLLRFLSGPGAALRPQSVVVNTHADPYIHTDRDAMCA